MAQLLEGWLGIRIRLVRLKGGSALRPSNDQVFGCRSKCVCKAKNGELKADSGGEEWQ